jgi:hypothetical protein
MVYIPVYVIEAQIGRESLQESLLRQNVAVLIYQALAVKLPFSANLEVAISRL